MQENKPWVLVKGSDIENSEPGSQSGVPAVRVAAPVHARGQRNHPGPVERPSVLQCDPGHKIWQNSQTATSPAEVTNQVSQREVMWGCNQSCSISNKALACGLDYRLIVHSDMTIIMMKHPNKQTEVFCLMSKFNKKNIKANKVRDLKAKKAEKGVIDAEVKILLDLKKQLADAQVPSALTETGGGKKKGVKQDVKVTANNVTSSPAEVERLNKLVTEQGNKVRELMTAKAEKALVDTEVSKLLDLKRQLALAQGENPDASPAVGKQKGKKK
ncbi:hypothetical protein DPMN_169366 [Dreissena polymorpha]|uniref:WHEP-TRS domain-containing protein n=1 Tax=Dreissena polymorpha TaxID=45954 RepID=A0A9D4IC57_DREPO|nr:hypothetical protein DPMN_169366 [Dreissena polymorpha]